MAQRVDPPEVAPAMAQDVLVQQALAQDRTKALQLTPVPAAVLERLDRFVPLLLTWQRRINLVAPSTLPHLWTRHVADSLQLLALAPEARRWVDLGSGAGFPGIVLGCLLADRPGATIDLVESNGKKAAFLRSAAQIVDAPIAIHHGRIEDFVATIAQTVDIVTARALAPLDRLLAMCHPLIHRGAQAVFPKGQDVEAELTEASKCWSITATLVPSRTDPHGRIVVIRQAERRP
jgi:16S rRNA (guanine527-N7)-methyltransferase